MVRLTDQNYFIQRILNRDQRFARSPTYMYAAVGYIEMKQLLRNIGIAGTRGKKVESHDGSNTYELNDDYTVLEGIKNTPKYMRKLKYEMIAKLENLGPFQMFFTLSSAEMRWDENVGSVLRDLGLKLHYSTVRNKEGHHNTKIEVEYQKNGLIIRKNVKDYIS